MIAGVFVFSIMDAFMKRLSDHYGPMQVSCMRCLSSLLCLFAMIARQRAWSSLRATVPLMHLWRGALGIAMLACFVYAVHRLTLAQTYSLFLAAPLLMTALSVPLQGEHVSGRRWFAIVVGMSGVLWILQPWSKGFVSMAAASAAAVATICYSLNGLTVRSLGRSNSSMSMVFWYLALVSLGSGMLAVGDWRSVLPGDWLWLAGIGISGALGQYLADGCVPARSAVRGRSVRIHRHSVGIRDRLAVLVRHPIDRLGHRRRHRHRQRHLRHLGRAPPVDARLESRLPSSLVGTIRQRTESRGPGPDPLRCDQYQ